MRRRQQDPQQIELVARCNSISEQASLMQRFTKATCPTLVRAGVWELRCHMHWSQTKTRPCSLKQTSAWVFLATESYYHFSDQDALLKL
eukprot:scaffold51081_cov18-Tisochrysis_lutea.AAC.2